MFLPSLSELPGAGGPAGASRAGSSTSGASPSSSPSNRLRGFSSHGASPYGVGPKSSSLLAGSSRQLSSSGLPVPLTAPAAFRRIDPSRVASAEQRHSSFNAFVRRKGRNMPSSATIVAAL